MFRFTQCAALFARCLLDGCRDGVQERLIQYRLASKSTAPAVIAYTVTAMSL